MNYAQYRRTMAALRILLRSRLPQERNDSMIHFDEIDTLTVEQIRLMDNAPSVESYLDNLGVCPDCLQSAAMAWLGENAVVVMQQVVHEGVAPDEAMNSFICAAYYRGFILGLLLGREHKP